MSDGQRVAEDGQNSRRPQVADLGYALVAVFLGTLIAGVLETIVFSASGCFLSHVIRCFSIQRDLVGVTLLGLKMWSVPALLAALFVIGIGGARGSVAWWNVLIAAPTLYLVLAILTIKSIDVISEPEFWVQSAILFLNVQLSLFVGRLSGRLTI